MVSITIRALDADEHDLLLRATVDNFNWDRERFTASDVLLSPEMVYYTELSASRGDFGFVALTDDDTPVGVAWALFLPPTRPGYGFVQAGIPEVSLWVEKTHRREGIGRALIKALQTGARLRDLPGLSLSVASGNPARDLYLSEGFVAVDDERSPGVMLWRRT